MNPLFERFLRRTASLGRASDLHRATAVIQAALSRSLPASIHAKTGLDVIDVPAREVAGRFAGAPSGPVPSAPSTGERTGSSAFVAGRFADAGAARDYKLFIPAQAGKEALPLVVMLHGCTQGADDFAAGTAMNDLATRHGFYVLYPEQTAQANPQRCWNWFKHSHQARGRGEPALLAGMTRDLMGRHKIDPARVYVAGLSAGGAMAAILGDAYPDLFAAVGVHSGLACGMALDLPSALGAMRTAPAAATGLASRMPTIVFHGDADKTVHPGNAGRVIAGSVPSHAARQTHEGVGAGGRRYTRHVHHLDGRCVAEQWVVHGGPHAWSGGSSKGSYTDPAGPSASQEMVRFFLEHRNA